MVMWLGNKNNSTWSASIWNTLARTMRNITSSISDWKDCWAVYFQRALLPNFSFRFSEQFPDLFICIKIILVYNIVYSYLFCCVSRNWRFWASIQLLLLLLIWSWGVKVNTGASPLRTPGRVPAVWSSFQAGHYHLQRCPVFSLQ